MTVYLFEDDRVADLEPLTLSRPAFDLRCGASTLLERQLGVVPGRRVGVWVRDHLAPSCRLAHPRSRVNEPLAGVHARGPQVGQASSVLINARWLPPPGNLAPEAGEEVGLVDGQVAYALLRQERLDTLTFTDLPRRLAEWKDLLPRHQAGGRMINYPWDLVEANAEALENDFACWTAERERTRPGEGVAILGPSERVVVDPGARVEPLTVLDTTRGPILIDREAVVRAFSRIEGPCYVGPRSQVLGATVRGSSIGPECRVGGEVEASLVHGYTNKAHEGFLGHAYVGEWVNLGAGTTNSDLRNDYGPVSVYVRGKRVDTGLLKVGLFVGDHTKTSIGTLFNTGSQVGPFAMLVASGGLAPKVVPAFCQFSNGTVQERATLGEMFATAAVVMSRRQRAWTDTHAELFLEVYEQTAVARRRLVQEMERRGLRKTG